MTTTAPGWYDDGHGALRWWDGTQWTEHVAQPDEEPSPAPSEAEIVAARLGFEQPGAAAEAGVEAPAQPGHPAAPHNAQGAYPGTPAGDVPSGGAFAAATEPRSTSKLWIVWVVLGVVLLGIVIAAAVLIPLLLLSASTATSGQSDDERAAVATIGLYDEAWQEGDCEKLDAATTENFRETGGLTDCAVFQQEAAAFIAGVEDYTVSVAGVETVGDEITVTTNETYLAIVDENGEPIEPTESAITYEYTLVESDGDWLIDYLYTE